MKKFRFRKFQIYQDARRFSIKCKQLTRAFPEHEKYSLRSQLNRAMDSVILNIAEGADRGTDKDFAHFLNNSHTSLNEVVSCLDIALDCEYLFSESHQKYLKEAEALANQLTAFRSSLLSRPDK